MGARHSKKVDWLLFSLLLIATLTLNSSISGIPVVPAGQIDFPVGETRSAPLAGRSICSAVAAGIHEISGINQSMLDKKFRNRLENDWSALSSMVPSLVYLDARHYVFPASGRACDAAGQEASSCGLTA